MFGTSSFLMLMSISRSAEELANLLNDENAGYRNRVTTKEKCPARYRFKAEICGRDFRPKPRDPRRNAVPASTKPAKKPDGKPVSEPVTNAFEPVPGEPVYYTCPGCGCMFEIDPVWNGRKAECLDCHKRFKIKIFDFH